MKPESAVLLAGSISGVPAAKTCPLTCTSALLVPPIVEFVMELVKEPTLAPDAMRTKTFVVNVLPGSGDGMSRLLLKPSPLLANDTSKPVGAAMVTLLVIVVPLSA